MKKTFFTFFLILVWIITGGEVVAGDNTEPQSMIFDIQHLEKIKKESFTDFLNDINERDIFSSPAPETPDEVVPPREVVKKRPELNMVYRGNLQIDGNQVAMIEAIKNGVKKSYFVKKGEFIEGFRIVDIQNEFVVIYSQKKGKMRLPFSEKR